MPHIKKDEKEKEKKKPKPKPKSKPKPKKASCGCTSCSAANKYFKMENKKEFDKKAKEYQDYGK